MRKKLIVFLIICTLLIATMVLPVSGKKIVDENEAQICGLAPAQADSNLFNHHFETDVIGGLESRGIPFYAYNYNDPSGMLVEGPVYFYPSDPGTITQIAATSSTDFISGGTWTSDGIWYGCEWGYYGNSNIWIINNETGAMDLVGSYDPGGTGLSFNGLAYDPISDIMYGCSSTALYKVNMTTGASTLVGSFGISGTVYMIGIAFDDMGNLYGDELTTDSLYKINPSTGVATLIGLLGIDILYAQDMSYDNDTQTLYLSAYTVSPQTEGALYTCNTTTGAATKIGTFQGSAQITGFAIPYEEGEPGPDTTSPQIKNIAANPNPQIKDGPVNITCDVTDDRGVDEVWVNITYPDATSRNFTMAKGSGSNYYFEQTYTDIGTYNYFIWANDTSGNSNISTIYTFLIIEGSDSTPPVTTHQFTPATPDGDNDWYVSDVTITFSAVDDISGVAWTKYSLNNGGTWTTHTGPGAFDVIVSSGIYQILYYSADNVGNVESTNGPFVIMVDTVKPQKSFFSFPIILGPVYFALFSIGFAKDSISGLERVEYYLNGTFHHQTNLSWWPTGLICPIYWLYIAPALGDVCTCTVYDKAGNSV